LILQVKGAIVAMELKGIYKSYEELKVIMNLSLKINEKEITCVLGPSGCGKSTLLNIIAGIIQPDAGYIEGKSNRIGYVFQEDRLLPWKTVYENIRLVNKKATDKRINSLIEMVGLKGFEGKYPSQLSGGMRQRCSIARAFNYESDLLLMDEPFKSLDYDLRINMVKGLVDIWNSWNNSILFVTHEIDEALLLGDKIVVLEKDPCTVEAVINVNIPQSLRSLDDRELVNLRIKLLKMLTKNKDDSTSKSA